MQAMPPSGSPAAAAGVSVCFLPALQTLDLRRCELQHEQFLQLSQLALLTSLELAHVTLCAADWEPVTDQQECDAFATVLQQLQALESLELADGVALYEPAAALAPLSTMQRLQHLSLCAETCSTASLAHLPSSLTRLDLQGYDVHVGLGDLSMTTASLPRLPSLRAAHLAWLRLEPGVMGSWKGLTQLSMSNVLLTTPGVGPASGQHQSSALRAFLVELAKRTQLQDLMLYTMDDQVLHSVRDMQVFSALTASTQLTELQIVESAEDQPIFPLPLPKGALQAMFCPPKQWPFLQALRIEVTDSDGFDMDADHWCVDAQGIGHLAKCLPALNSLSLVYVVKDCDTVAAFTQLMPTLTHLSVGGRAFDNTVARLVAQLTTLQALEWSYSMITSSALRRLTSLTNLDSLEIRDSPLVGVTNCTGLSGMNGLELSTSGEAAQVGTHDVWQQLQQLCK